MTNFAEQNTPSDTAPSAQILALLQELRDMLDSLATSGQSNAIDIRSLPMLPGDYEFLTEFFGEGEVTATINALGPTSIKETRIPGIWWVTHRNANDEVLSELIEVTVLPEMLKTQQTDLKDASDILASYLTDMKLHR